MFRSTLMLALMLLLGARPARALGYCQATTVQTSMVCPSPCSTAGLPVFWGTPQIEYAFNMRPFPGLDEAKVRTAIANSFATWEDVQCDGVRLGFAFTELAASTSLTIGPLETEPNLNVISVLNAGEWAALGFDASEFARTKVWFDENSGEIVGADIAFNAALMPFATCVDPESCAAGAVDLQNVATHEIGHLLGLAHSSEPSATMWCGAQRDDHEKRTLAPDDLAGLCAATKNGAAFLDPGATKPDADAKSKDEGGGCALHPSTTRSAGPWQLLVLGLLALRWRAGRPFFARAAESALRRAAARVTVRTP